MRSKLIEIIKEVMSDSGKVPKMEITETTSLRKDLEFDSLDLAVLTVKIEDEFDIDIFEDGIVDTFEEIINKLREEE